MAKQTARAHTQPQPSSAGEHEGAAKQPPKAEHASAHERKQRVLTHTSPSGVASIAGALVIKNEDVFFLCDRSGKVPLDGKHGYGLYYRDCRFLNGYEIHFGDTFPDVLAASAAADYAARLELSNGVVSLGGGKTLAKERVTVRWQRVIDGESLALKEVLTVRNHGIDRLTLPLSFHFDTAFEDIFIVRGLLAEDLGKIEAERWKDGVLRFIYDGSDGVWRSLSAHLTPAPDRTDGTTAVYDVSLASQESAQIRLTLVVAEGEARADIEPSGTPAHESERVSSVLRRGQSDWLRELTAVHSHDPVLDRVLHRSLLDLRALRTSLHDCAFFAAGVPWFVTLFGRDSAIAGLQTLAYEPSIAEQTLRLLAEYQGREVNDWKDEQPGKILHELRVGELATRGSIPYTPYYGSVDATPLWLILLVEHARWTGSLALFRDLRENVERALKWIDDYGDLDGDGFVEYASDTEHGLVNQGWKDSGDAIVNADGSLAHPPIALVEVQGYVYRAKQGLAELYERDAEGERAWKLRAEADALREKFNQAFWLDEHGFYALALQQEKRPCAVLTSNPGQALWTGIVSEGKAVPTVERLFGPDMFSGWGVRTFSTKERRYNPVGYHLGTVWPHDNSIVAAGCRRYGHDGAALRIFDGIVRAAAHFPNFRLPEVFAGLPRSEYRAPVEYPVACHPQAWAAGAVPFLLQTLLGLEPAGFERTLRVVRPILPARVTSLDLRGIRLGGGRAHLRLHRRRGAKGGADVEIVRADGIDVVVEND
jgi:glycogen debranching enzyme